VKIMPEFNDVLEDMKNLFSEKPLLVSTSAKNSPNTISYSEARSISASSSTPLLIVLGTGWGLAEEIMEKADYQLSPIDGCTPYNHLSVRAAAAITLDRLFGKSTEN